MKLKIAIIFMMLCSGSIVYSSAIIERPSSIGSAIQSSNIVRTNDIGYNSETINRAIAELKYNIKKNPENYLYNVSLADLFIRTKQFDKSYIELVYLNNLNNRNKLNSDVLNEVKSLGINLKKLAGYETNKIGIYVNLAVIFLILNENEKAENYIDVAAANYNKSDLLLDALSKVFDETKNYNRAIDICDKMLSVKPSDNKIRKIKAAYLLQLDDKSAATDEYVNIITNDSSDMESKYSLYKLLSSQNMSEKDVIKYLYKDNSVDKSQVYYEIANMLLQNNDIDEAKQYVNILIDKYPDNANGYILLSDIYRKEGKIKESYEILTKVRDKADSNEAIAQYNVLLAKLSDEPLKEANSLMANNLYKEALEVLNSANPENLYVILAQARANYFLSYKQKSLDLLNKAMTLYPNNSDVFCAFSYIYTQEHDIDSARKYINKSLEINPENRTAKDLLKVINKAEADKYVNRIITSFESQNYSETMRLIDEALAISPEHALLYYYKALTYIAQNDYASSTAALYKCLELDKNNNTAYFYLGIAFDNLEEPQNALLYYKKFIDLLPQDDYGESEKLKYARDRIAKLEQK